MCASAYIGICVRERDRERKKKEGEVHCHYQPDLLKREGHAGHDSQTKWAISVGQEGPGMQEGDWETGRPP